MRDNTTDYRELFLNDIPMMDMRAPVEFTKGAFPNAVSLPLMTDIERQKVGTCYKQKGQQAAIELGHQLVSGKVKAARVEAWAAFARANSNGYLYCFRGGLALADRPAVACRRRHRLPAGDRWLQGHAYLPDRDTRQRRGRM